jgi:hypothetical protein
VWTYEDDERGGNNTEKHVENFKIANGDLPTVEDKGQEEEYLEESEKEIRMVPAGTLYIPTKITWKGSWVGVKYWAWIVGWRLINRKKKKKKKKSMDIDEGEVSHKENRKLRANFDTINQFN